MWDGAGKILNAVRERGARKVYCNNRRCYSGRMSVPRTLVGGEAYVIAAEEFVELSRLVDTMEALKHFFEVLLNTGRGSRMFSIVTETWNPVTGCPHNCRYCWARKLAMTKLKDSERYRDGFNTRFNPKELRRRFRGGIVFVSDMGDLFADTVKDEWIKAVLNRVAEFPNTYFLFLTKNPERYEDFLGEFPPNSILGATIETDDDDLYLEHRVSGAPLPSKRIKAMRGLNWKLKFLSIEPILDFSPEFSSKIMDIAPFMVYVGYDNYNNRLPEPPQAKTQQLIQKLRSFTLVVEKTIRPAWYEKK